MTAWRHKPMTGFDLETTGLSVENDRIVTACVAILRPKPAGPWSSDVHSWLVDPGIDIPEEATKVHGVTTEHAKEHGQPAAEAVDLIAGDVALSLRAAVPLVGMNLVYDLTLLDRECRRHGLPTVGDRIEGPIAPVIDIYCIDKALDQYRPGKRKLSDLCELYGARLDGAHDSSADALAAVRVAWRMALRAEQGAEALRVTYADRRYPDRLVKDWLAFGRMSVTELHAAQIGWYREQSESFAQYLRTQANELRHKAEAVDTADPETRAIAEQELAELEQRIDGIRGEWPIAPLVTQGALL